MTTRRSRARGDTWRQNVRPSGRCHAAASCAGDATGAGLTVALSAAPWAVGQGTGDDTSRKAASLVAACRWWRHH